MGRKDITAGVAQLAKTGEVISLRLILAFSGGLEQYRDVSPTIDKASGL
jgi:hypothetical protein